MFVVSDAKLLLDNLADAVAGPNVSTEAIRFSAMPEEVSDQFPLPWEQFPGRAWAQAAVQSVWSDFSGGRQPLTDGRSADAQGLSDVAWRPPLLAQLPGTHPPPLAPIVKCGPLMPHTSILTQSVKFSARRSVTPYPSFIL